MARRSKKGEADSPALPGIKDDEDMARTIEFRERVIRAEKEIELAEANLVEAKETHDAAKGRLKDAQAEMRKITREEANPENYPLINEVEKKARSRAKEKLAGTKAKLDESGPDWRRIQVTEIGISEYAAETLKEAGMGHVGAVFDFAAGGGKLKTIQGLGDAEVRMIEEALSKLADRIKAEEQQAEEAKAQADGMPLAKLDGMKPIILKCLEVKGGITTIEQALAHIEKHGSLSTVPGIGERAAGQIADAIAKHCKPTAEADRTDETPLWEVGNISVQLRKCLENAGLSTVEAVQRYDREQKKLSDIDGISTGEAIHIMGAIDEFTGEGKAAKPKKARAGTAKKPRPASTAG